MCTTTRDRIYMATIILSSAGIIALSLLSGCLIPGGSCETDKVHYGGSPDCEPLVTSNDLEGTWCNQRSPQTCLTVDQRSYPQTRYTLTIGLCTERGSLTGGLEFSPDTTSQVCLPGFINGLWSSASATFTNHGLYLYDIDQCQGSVCGPGDTGFVYANDLDLAYTGH